MPRISEKCIKSWEKYGGDFKIMRHDESNFDFTKNRYVREGYEAKKWAFVSDYVRLKAVYEYGGVYLDTDVELIKPLKPLIENGGFMGFERESLISTGLGFAAEKGNPLIGELLRDYDGIPFIKPDGTYDLTPCPDRNTQTIARLGMDITKQNQTFMGIKFLPEEYLCPMDYYTGKTKITKNTYSIHHYSASWTTKRTKRTTFIKRIIGVKMYDKLYGRFLHKCKWLEW